jgi:Tol biopolymer transport system component/DNA-binding winged helix-turn-helix (wHTH) protein
MNSAPALRFGPFQLDVRAGELCKNGIRVRLPEQSLQLLLMLLDHPGEVVSREEIRLRLWPNQTVVDFDQSISAVVRRLRSALGDTASSPRFIETLAKRGYRFVGELERAALPAPPAPHYRLLEKIGEGGMGVVYRAEDTQLGRFVAVKFPPPGGSLPAEALLRFEQEARAASALNHPNICTIYGLDYFEGRPGIVMELLTGDTLAARLARGPLPSSEALDIAGAILRALSEAHAAGVVHRDLKPANVILTRNGVKVLDFGLATMDAVTDENSAQSESGAPGTLQYMSPEQKRGGRVDARSDLFSFGLVLFETLSGRLPSAGESVSGFSAGVSRFVARCLAEDPDARWQSARLALDELERIAAGKAESVPPPQRRWPAWRWSAAAAAVVVSAVVGFFLWPKSLSPLPPSRTVPLTSLPGLSTFASFSPEGDKVAYSWIGPPGQSDSHLNIYVKPTGNGEPVKLTSGMDDRFPQWSPDGSEIAYQSSSKSGHDLMVVRLGSGETRKISEMGVGLSWSPDGKEIAYIAPYAPAGSGGLVVRSLATGQVRELTRPQPLAEGVVAWSPDSRQIAFTRSFSGSARELYVMPSQGGEARRLTFDNQITEGFAWTADSRELVFASYRFGGPALWRILAKGGTPERISSPAHHPSFPAIARRGNRLVFADSFVDTNIWQYEMKGTSAGNTTKCLICSTSEDDSPRYSPDGRKIVFVSKRTGSEELWVADSDGAYPMQLTTIGGAPVGSPRWSPDGHWIAFDSRLSGSPDVFVISAQGGAPRRLTTEPSSDVEPSWSHDGKWIYFASDRGQQMQIWKMPFAGGAAQRVSQGDGGEPLESPDGRRVFYFRGSGRGVASVPVTGGVGESIPQLSSVLLTRAWAIRQEGIYFFDFASGKPQLQLFSFATQRVSPVMTLNRSSSGTNPGLDISPDGRHLLYTQIDQRVEGLKLIENFR